VLLTSAQSTWHRWRCARRWHTPLSWRDTLRRRSCGGGVLDRGGRHVDPFDIVSQLTTEPFVIGNGAVPARGIDPDARRAAQDRRERDGGVVLLVWDHFEILALGKLVRSSIQVAPTMAVYWGSAVGVWRIPTKATKAAPGVS
jgi:hypothetical protein